MRPIAFLPVLALVLAAPVSGAAGQAPVLPDWMTGCWVEDRGGPWTEECWMAPRAGMMLGASRSGAGDRINSWEFLRIATNADNGEGPSIRMTYRASPQGGGSVMFAWSPTEDGRLTFFNAAHDYPQRIRYWREGDQLKAEIALLDGSRARQWTYDPARR